MKTKCWSCGKPADSKEDRCHGCLHIVCIDCAEIYGHFMNGAHGRKKVPRKIIKKKVTSK